MNIWTVDPLDLREALREERQDLLDLVGNLADAQWQTPTACPGWRVKDLALHLLDDDLGWLSRGRDGDLEGLLPTGLGYRNFVARLTRRTSVGSMPLEASAGSCWWNCWLGAGSGSPGTTTGSR